LKLLKANQWIVSSSVAARKIDAVVTVPIEAVANQWIVSSSVADQKIDAGGIDCLCRVASLLPVIIQSSRQFCVGCSTG
jgi:hypothetical protein